MCVCVCVRACVHVILLVRKHAQGQAYVAISRASSIDGLEIRNWSRECIKSSRLVRDLYAAIDRGEHDAFVRSPGLWWGDVILRHPLTRWRSLFMRHPTFRGWVEALTSGGSSTSAQGQMRQACVREHAGSAASRVEVLSEEEGGGQEGARAQSVGSGVEGGRVCAGGGARAMDGRGGGGVGGTGRERLEKLQRLKHLLSDAVFEEKQREIMKDL